MSQEILQKYLPLIIKNTYSRSLLVRSSLLDFLKSTVHQDLISPGPFIPSLGALVADPNPRINGPATEMLSSIFEKHGAFFRAETKNLIRATYELSSAKPEVVDQTQTAEITLERVYSMIQRKKEKKQRKFFLHDWISFFDLSKEVFLFLLFCLNKPEPNARNTSFDFFFYFFIFIFFYFFFYKILLA